jgi:hypothetical protein
MAYQTEIDVVVKLQAIVTYCFVNFKLKFPQHACEDDSVHVICNISHA